MITEKDLEFSPLSPDTQKAYRAILAAFRNPAFDNCELLNNLYPGRVISLDDARKDRYIFIFPMASSKLALYVEGENKEIRVVDAIEQRIPEPPSIQWGNVASKQTQILLKVYAPICVLIANYAMELKDAGDA